MIWTVLAAIGTVVAAVIPLMVWSQNRREQSTGSRLLAQMMIAPIGATQVEIAKFRCTVVPPNGDQSYLVNVLNSQQARKDLASRASRIPLDLPQQFLDKAGVFSELTNSKVSFALSQVSRLKSLSVLVGDLSDSAREEEINELVLAVLTQIKEAEEATGEAFQALLKAGKASA
jgi:HAMP domain-containing protein